MAISIKQAITSHRALQHVAWGIKKDLTAQMKALDDQPKARSRVATTLSRWTAIHFVLFRPISEPSFFFVFKENQDILLFLNSSVLWHATGPGWSRDIYTSKNQQQLLKGSSLVSLHVIMTFNLYTCQITQKSFRMCSSHTIWVF